MTLPKPLAALTGAALLLIIGTGIAFAVWAIVYTRSHEPAYPGVCMAECHTTHPLLLSTSTTEASDTWVLRPGHPF